MAGFLALNGRISIVRHEPLPFPHPTIKPLENNEDITNLRMAVATALPTDADVLNLEQEVENIKQAVQDFAIEGVKLTIEPEIESATVKDIAALPKGTYIFHFAGHGVVETTRDRAQPGGLEKTEGALVLVQDKETRQEARMRANDLAVELQEAGVRLAFLGACQSGERHEKYPWNSLAGALTAYELPAVLAMQHPVDDRAAIAFSKAFYAALLTGLSLDEAMFAGRRATLLEMTTSPDAEEAGILVPIEWGVPVLYTRLPDGKLFPERMGHAGETAQAYRHVLSQSVDLIESGGRVTGPKVEVVNGSLHVVQAVTTVEGILDAGVFDEVNAKMRSTQNINKVGKGGVVKGPTIKSLG